MAQRIAAFHRAGIELFMLQFQPFEASMREFAGQVIPRVKALIDEWRPEPGGIVNRAVAD